jgi:hypothetical protein
MLAFFLNIVLIFELRESTMHFKSKINLTNNGADSYVLTQKGFQNTVSA